MSFTFCLVFVFVKGMADILRMGDMQVDIVLLAVIILMGDMAVMGDTVVTAMGQY